MSDLKVITQPGMHSIEFTRTFDAPRELVFRAHTDPKMIPQWWGPAKYKTTVERLEAKFGGAWRFVQSDSNGNEFAFRGVFHEVTAPERLVQTFEFEGFPGHVALDSMTLEDVGGKTRIKAVSVFQSVADRDGMVQSGMEGGMEEGFVRLDELLKKMRAGAGR
jgi:uncharacterized protein YndB with AHSA1/START domain